MKIVHIMTESGAIKADKEVADDYQLQANESFTLPTIPAYTLDYQPIKQKAEITPEQQLAQLVLQQAQFQATQQKLNSQLALQVAQLTAKEVK